MADLIRSAESDADYDAFGALVAEYWGWLQARYADVPGVIDQVGGHQALDVELASVRAKYEPPSGAVLLAEREGEVVGGVAYLRLSDDQAEMKRLFVPERHQGHGTGRALVLAILERARSDGFPRMCLDTGVANTEAIAMYLGLGFVEVGPYHDYPADLLPHLRFFERDLTTLGA